MIQFIKRIRLSEAFQRHRFLRLRFLVPLGLVVAGVAYLGLKDGDDGGNDTYITVEATRGSIRHSVSSTGILQAVVTVQVGSEVSGRVRELDADFNSLVKKGQLLAVIDPANFEAQRARAQAVLGIARANVKNAEAALGNRRAELISSKANLEAARVARKDAAQVLKRARELHEDALIPEREIEAAQASFEQAAARENQAAAQVNQIEAAIGSAQAQLEQAEASVKQAEAELRVAEVNLRHTRIISPIDGVVIERNVDIGQTVAASFQAPVLFLIANDLRQMQVIAQVDEADIGALSEEAQVEFIVDAFPQDTFHGKISEIRLSSKLPASATPDSSTGGGSTSNVVTYNVIIDVANPDLKLRPGMTANVTFTVAAEQNVLKIANAALRYQPADERMSEQLEKLEHSPKSGAPAGTVQEASSSQGGTPESGNSRRGRGWSRGRDDGAPRSARNQKGQQPPGKPRVGSGPLRADAERPTLADNPSPDRYRVQPEAKIHFPPTEVSRPRWSTVWALDENGELAPHRVKLGITNGRETAVLEGELSEGAMIVTGEYLDGDEVGARSPFGGPFGRRRPRRQQRRRR